MFCNAIENTEGFTRLYQSQNKSNIDTEAIIAVITDRFVRGVRAEIQ